jgi:hypothetical protein
MANILYSKLVMPKNMEKDLISVENPDKEVYPRNSIK